VAEGGKEGGEFMTIDNCLCAFVAKKRLFGADSSFIYYDNKLIFIRRIFPKKM
jgi:hypothetical protein